MSSELPTGAAGAQADILAFGRFWPSVAAGARLALNWRLLLLWLLALALPLLLMMTPLALALGDRLNHSLLGAALAEQGELRILAEAGTSLGQGGFNPTGAGLGALLITLLLSPWLSGMVLALARARRTLGFAELIQGGLQDYGRLARMLIWSLLPLGVAAAVFGALSKAAGEHATQAILESDADQWQQLALLLGGLLLVVVHATVDAARALLVIEPRRRSVVLAWGRALVSVLRRPSQLLVYLLITATGLALVAGLGVLRLQVVPSAGWSVALAWLLGQAMVLALVWMRAARLLALVELGRR